MHLRASSCRKTQTTSPRAFCSNASALNGRRRLTLEARLRGEQGQSARQRPPLKRARRGNKVNKMNYALYYPTIEFQDYAWLWSASLLWDRIYRIVPKGYEP